MMMRTERRIASFIAFETVGLSILLALATAGVDEFRNLDPTGWWPLFVVLKAIASTALLSGGSFACGWGMSRLRALFAAKRIARTFRYA